MQLVDLNAICIHASYLLLLYHVIKRTNVEYDLFLSCYVTRTIRSMYSN